MAKPLLDRVLVVDVEATCWDGPAPDGMVSEIIEIGLCELEVATGQRSGRRSLMVEPERSTVSPFCTGLTTITPEQAADGIGFAEACEILRDEYGAGHRVWASWGEYDRAQFTRQCTATDTRYPFGTRHLNVKNLYSLMNSLDRELGMAGALQHAGLPLEGTHHRGVDDAWNIAGLLSGLLGR
ncbi:3'-5' exonuclease [Streptomyces sp. NPDC005336]|uniref:3'-5' exonuclease n=1 Tax=Streptomyces sp. NPDC005336 TaxID=3157035 RepID=UPI0033AD4FE2